MNIGFIGFGKMAEALAKGVVARNKNLAPNIVAFGRSSHSKAVAKKSGIPYTTELFDVLSNCSIVFLCVKPQQMLDMLFEIKTLLEKFKNRKITFVSIAAGIPLATFKERLGKEHFFARVMPNTPALYSEGVSAVCFDVAVSPAVKKVIRNVLQSVGYTIEVNEKYFSAVTALSGSGPAYVFYLAEAMEKAGSKLGLPSEISRELAYKTIYGAGTMLKEATHNAETLRSNVTSKKGTTEAAINVFEENKVRLIVEKALKKACSRSNEIGKLYK